jgi:carboxyl-terminal processing protease
MLMRKTSLILLGAAAGVAVTLIATQPRIVLDGARAQTAAADTYSQLSLFGDVFERVRAAAVRAEPAAGACRGHEERARS